jgi:hypothetical protein
MIFVTTSDCFVLFKIFLILFFYILFNHSFTFNINANLEQKAKDYNHNKVGENCSDRALIRTWSCWISQGNYIC